MPEPAPVMVDVAAKMTLSVAEVAALLSMGERTVWRLLASGELESIKARGRRLVARSAIEAYLRRLAGAPAI